MYTKDFSIIVPCWRGAIKFLPKLFDSIPDKEGIEIIVVDNSLDPVCRDEIKSDREIIFLHSDHNRHAGGGRNDGIAVSRGKWLLFADADDYYTPDAFDTYYSMIDTDAEIVYTCIAGIYEDTGEPSDRGKSLTQMVHQYCMGEMDEMILRTSYNSPCAKMVSHKLVEKHQLKFDEVRASNDIYFSLTSGFYAKKIEAIDRVTYIATVNHGSLTQRHDFEVIRARLYAKLKCNQFLRKNGLKKYQKSVMAYLYDGLRYSIRQQFVLWGLIIRFKQNPFIGWRRWGKTFDNQKTIKNRDVRYRIE